MKVSQEFINNLWFKGGWHLETINNHTFSVINNQLFCRLFWMQYWLEILWPAFKNQTHITYVHDVDLTTKVIVDNTNGNLLSAPPSFVNIYYYGTFFKDDVKEPLFMLQNPTLFIVIFIIFIIIAINIAVALFPARFQKIVEIM